jgi:bleomycin hydrolase
MKNLTLIISTIILTATITYAQKGAIDIEVIKEMQSQFMKDENNIMRMNALSNNSIKDIALNRNNLSGIEHHFKHKVDVKGISDQKSSGRCWLFTSLNVIRPKVIEKYDLSDFHFSQNHLFFWDQFEKANLFLENIIQHANEKVDSRINHWLLGSPVGDGGVWSSFTNLVTKYGLVPSSIMPETHNSESTSYMRRMLNRKLREFALELREMHTKGDKYKDLEKRKVEMMGVVYKMLALNLGQPPMEFNYRFVGKNGTIGETKTYTPISFSNEILPSVNYNNYVMLMNDPTREYYKLYEIENDRNVMEGLNWTYINLPNDDIKKYAVESIKGNDAMYGSCDVGKQLNSDIGLLDIENYDFESVYGVTFGMNKKERIISRESGSSHGMAMVAVDVDKEGKTTKWQFENSWGSSSGHDGYLTFTDKWFDEYMFRVVVLKKYLPEEITKILKEKAIMLPPWDPMFSQDK